MSNIDGDNGHMNTTTKEELLRILECPVCMETFDEHNKPPIAFDCQHPLCSPCVKKIALEGRITCPTCNKVCALKTKDVSKLPKDLARLSLMDILNKDKRQRETVRQCGDCDEGEDAQLYCEVCDKYLCEHCAKSHRRLRATKQHELVDVKNTRGATPSESSVTVIKCEREGHEKQELVNFCLTCDILVCEQCGKDEHSTHNVQSSGNVYSAKGEEIGKLMNVLSNEKYMVLNERSEKAARQVIDIQVNLCGDVKSQFQTYRNIIAEREQELLAVVEKWCKNRTGSLNTVKEQLADIKRHVALAETAVRELDRVAFLNQVKALKEALEGQIHREIQIPDVTSLVFSQVCPTDDFTKLVGTVLGVVQEDQHLTSEMTASKEPTTNSKATSDSIALSIDPRFATSPMMEVLKSINFSSGSVAQPGATAAEGATPSLPDPTHIADKTTMQNSSLKLQDSGRKTLYGSNHVKDLTANRFQTLNLIGSWEVGTDDVVMYSRTTEEADQCLRVLSETLVERRIPVRKDTMVLLDSDKWQLVNREMDRKYPAQATTSIDHARQQVICLATSAAVLEDIADTVNLFLRDNEVKQITLTYPEETLKRILKHKTSLDKLRASYSQFCVQVIKQSTTTIVLKGIGIGFGEAIRQINKLAQKCTSDEDRFDSDDDDEEDNDADDETRFEDDKEAADQHKADVGVEMAMGNMAVAGICLPGDHRMIYALCGDMTDLDVDVLVNSADPKLKHDGGLAKVIVKKGGRVIQAECSLHVTQHGQHGHLDVGDVYTSSAGSLPSRVIVHAVGPKWKDGNSGESELLKMAVHNSLQSVAGQRLSSVAIPAIGAGSYGMPVASACDVIVSAVRDFLTKQPRCSIREIYFCDITTATTQSFVEAMQRCFDKSDSIISSLNNTGSPPSACGREDRTRGEPGASIPFLMM